MDNNEEMEKRDDPGMNLEDSGAKLEEKGDMVDAKTATMDKPEWADKRIGCAMLAKSCRRWRNGK